MKKYDIVFLSRLIPEHLKTEVSKKRKNTMSDSGESLQWNIINGLEGNLNYPLQLFNFMPIQSYPRFYSEMFVKGGDFSHCEGAKDANFSFINIQYVKRLFMGCGLHRRIKKWAKKVDGRIKILIGYSLSPEFMKAMKIAKKTNKNIITSAIVADLPEYVILTKHIPLTTRIYLCWNRNQTYNKLKYIDTFTLLTEHMAERLVTNQKYIVMEGIATNCSGIVYKTSIEKHILYAGTLNERFGVLHLIESFLETKSNNLILDICGIGDAEEQIKLAAKKDSRIHFWGQIEKSSVMELMGISSVIVNPRNQKEIFTRYSFPSKNLEALSSGVPFIAYKLDGIPDEYDEYINYPVNNTTQALAELLDLVALDARGIYRAKAQRALLWVLANKNLFSQTNRILNMLNEMIEENK